MIIAIDIGNTNTSVALISGKKILKTDSVETGFRECFEKHLSKALRAISQDARAQEHKSTRRSGKTNDASSARGETSPEKCFGGRVTIDEVIICSVSPKALTIVKACVKKVFKVSPKIIGKDIIVPIKNKYDDPKQVGQDRLVCAYAAIELYGAPVVVVDLGTAITFDVISKRHEYLGGMIVPGIRLSAEALYNKTALLPKISIHKPKRLIGKTTEESILSGIFYGYGEMIKGIIDLLSKQFHQEPKIIVTGGFSDLMKHYVPEYKCIVEKELIFKGIALLIRNSM